ncbi:MAG TPA: YbhB/YbcL family Raf kinase inhibitor-like protein [Candidatus Binataceae bacterium]|nr:YbhB/YbcL family Raf kinase inhibitor-like protein [Candidatus Binataceae bacterium]
MTLVSPPQARAQFALSSDAFSAGATIPDANACTGENRSPKLEWNNAPANAVSFALIVEDPDAPGGTFIHWVAYEVPGSVTSLSAGIPKLPKIAGGGMQGVNSFGRIGYDGPCPPPGRVHHYHFRLLALDMRLKLDGEADAAAVQAAAAGHIVASAELVGTFSR